MAGSLHSRLIDAIGALEADDPIDLHAVEQLLAEVNAMAPSLPRAELALIKEAIDQLTEQVAIERDQLGEEIERLGEGRRGNRGYGQLRADRQGQRLYKRV